MLRFLAWNLDRFGKKGAEARMISHAAYLFRDNLDPVYGMDESGHMDAMALGWVVMQPQGGRLGQTGSDHANQLILQVIHPNRTRSQCLEVPFHLQ
jgi:hypothetical protein